MLVVTCFAHISDPLRGFVAALLLNAQVSHPKPRSCKRRHLEVERDGRLAPLSALRRRNQLHVCRQKTLCVALESLEAPHDAGVVWLIHRLASPAREDTDLGRVGWHRNLADDVRAEVALFEDGFQANRQLDFVLFRVLLDYRHNFEGQVYVLADSVSHHVEDAVRRDKSD